MSLTVEVGYKEMLWSDENDRIIITKSGNTNDYLEVTI